MNILLNILLIFPGFIVAFVIILYYERKIKNIINEAYKNKNKVRFYVARDRNKLLYLYFGKPIRSRFSFVSGRFGMAIVSSANFSKYGLNKKDYDNLKWEDEPIEVFINIKE